MPLPTQHRPGRHTRRRSRGLIWWLLRIDVFLFALCVIAGAVHG